MDPLSVGGRPETVGDFPPHFPPKKAMELWVDTGKMDGKMVKYLDVPLEVSNWLGSMGYN